MNFGWFDDNTSDSEFSRTVIHEFGHALGMIHEHQHPLAAIPWDKDKVYTYYAGYPNYWSKVMSIIICLQNMQLHRRSIVPMIRVR